MHTQEFFVPHILFMYYRILEVFLISFQIFFSHLLCVEHMDLCLAIINLDRQRGCDIGLKLLKSINIISDIELPASGM